MKNLLFGLIAFVIVLGASCKKEESVKQDVKTEETVKHDHLNNGAKSVIDQTYNPGIYPHVTGLCACDGCKSYYWGMTNIPRHKVPCVCPPITYDVNGGGTIPAPPYNDTWGGGCNNPNP